MSPRAPWSKFSSRAESDPFCQWKLLRYGSCYMLREAPLIPVHQFSITKKSASHSYCYRSSFSGIFALLFCVYVSTSLRHFLSPFHLGNRNSPLLTCSESHERPCTRAFTNKYSDTRMARSIVGEVRLWYIRGFYERILWQFWPHLVW